MKNCEMPVPLSTVRRTPEALAKIHAQCKVNDLIWNWRRQGWDRVVRIRTKRDGKIEYLVQPLDLIDPVAFHWFAADGTDLLALRTDLDFNLGRLAVYPFQENA